MSSFHSRYKDLHVCVYVCVGMVAFKLQKQKQIYFMQPVEVFALILSIKKKIEKELQPYGYAMSVHDKGIGHIELLEIKLKKPSK
jgi:hypothetical protein